MWYAKITNKSILSTFIQPIGPYGMTELYYRTYWPIVKNSVIRFVQVFFKWGYLLKEMNHTHLTIIPNIDNPSRVHHFRPIISLSSFNYKLIFKILANCLKLLFHKIISPTQPPSFKGGFNWWHSRST